MYQGIQLFKRIGYTWILACVFHLLLEVDMHYGELMVYLSQAALSNEWILNKPPLSLEVPCFKPLDHYFNKVFSTAEELKQTQRFFEAKWLLKVQ